MDYLGWDAKFDEWKNCKDGDFPLAKYQSMKLSSPETVHLRSEMFCQTFSRQIKRNLRLGWKDNLLSNILLSNMQKHAPLEPVTRKMHKQRLKPWITKGILKSISIKNKYCKKYLKITEFKLV